MQTSGILAAFSQMKSQYVAPDTKGPLFQTALPSADPMSAMLKLSDQFASLTAAPSAMNLSVGSNATPTSGSPPGVGGSLDILA
ncbi:MAG TPA: hypothetical protein PKM88_01380 [bacterium]|nr:hypothetical protein [bacterium]